MKTSTLVKLLKNKEIKKYKEEIKKQNNLINKKIKKFNKSIDKLIKIRQIFDKKIKKLLIDR